MRVTSRSISATRTSAASVQQRLFWRAIELGMVVVLLVVSIVGGSLVRANPPTYTADLTTLTPPSAGFDLVGMHIPEQNQDFAYSWSSGYTFAQLRGGYNAAPSYRAAVRLRAANPNGSQPLTFLANERPLATVTPDSLFRTYYVTVPPSVDGDTSIRFALQTTPFTTTSDPRQLGVIVTQISLTPIAMFSWVSMLWVGLLFVALWGWLRWRGATIGPTLAVCGLLLVGLLVVYGSYRSGPLSFPFLSTVVILASATVVALTRDTASRVALTALVLLDTFSGIIWPSWLTDDAFISFRYAQNLLAGNGLVYNVGERVEGYTNFLWTILAALGLALGGDIVFLAYAAGVVLALAILLLSYWLARRLLDPAWALVATLIIATSQSILVYTARGSGLETGLFTLLALGGSASVLAPRARAWSGILFALATLTRPEGVLVMGLSMLFLWLLDPADKPIYAAWKPMLQRLRPLLPMLIGYVLIVIPFMAWRISYYGDLLPNTFYAKTGGGWRQVVRGLSYAGVFVLALGGPLVLLCLSSVLRGWRRRLREWQGYLLLLVGVYSAYIVAVGGDHFPGDRFFVPLVPWIALLMADGVAWTYALAQQRITNRWLMPTALAIILLIFSANALVRNDPNFNIIIKGDDESLGIWRELGWWMYDHAAPGESIAASGAGAVAYYSDHETIDLLGLNDKHIARMANADMGTGTAGHEKRDPAYVLNVRRPTYIPQIWDEYFGGERGLRDQYTLITIQTRYGREMQLWKRLP